ncbi:MAG: hypothetical protein WD066_14150 [Planctomycetaceae bacterium]
MNDADRYYRNSGGVPFIGTLMTFATGLVGAVVFGLIYTLVCWYNPVVFFTIFATGCLGVGTGWAVRVGAEWGHVRNRLFATIVGAFCGAATVYFSWVGYVVASTNFGRFTLDPEILWGFVQQLAMNPIWSIGDYTPVGDELRTLWTIEAGVIILISLAAAGTVGRPYCEPCGAWTVVRKNAAAAASADPAPLRCALEEGKYEFLESLRWRAIDPDDRLLLTLHTCPRCRDSNYLTIDRHRMKVGHARPPLPAGAGGGRRSNA